MRDETRFKPNDRVRISPKHHWAIGAVGTVLLFPDGESHYRDVPALKGMIRFYWVAFDKPQTDADGDGPYIKAEIAEKYLQPVT